MVDLKELKNFEGKLRSCWFSDPRVYIAFKQNEILLQNHQ